MVADPQFCHLAHDVIRHVQALLHTEPTPYRRLEVEYSAAWQQLKSRDLSSQPTDALFWITELLDHLDKAT